MSQTSAALIYLYDNLFISIMTVFAITGIFYMIWRQKPKYLAVIGIFLVCTLVLFLPTPLSTLQVFSSLFRVDRFLILLSPFMAFAMGYGFLIIYNHFGMHTKNVLFKGTALILIVALYLGASLPSVILTESSETRLFFNSQELEGFDFVQNDVPYGSTLVSDYHTMRFFTSRFFSLTDELDLPYYDSRMLEGFDERPFAEDYSIIREQMFDDYLLLIGPINALNGYPPTKENRNRLVNYSEAIDKIYESGSITIGY